MTSEVDNPKTLRETVEHTLHEYFSNLDGSNAKNLHELVIKEAEIGLFRTVMHYAKGNQTKASEWLGLARGTLRKRLEEYGIE